MTADIAVELWNETDTAKIADVAHVLGTAEFTAETGAELGAGQLEVMTRTIADRNVANQLSTGRHLRWKHRGHHGFTGRINRSGTTVIEAEHPSERRRTITCVDNRDWLQRAKVRHHPQTPPGLRGPHRQFSWHSPEMDVSGWPMATMVQLAVSLSWQVPNTQPPWFTPWLPPDGWPVVYTPVISGGGPRTYGAATTLFVKDHSFAAGLHQILVAGWRQVTVFVDGVRVGSSKPAPAACWQEPLSILLDLTAGTHRIAIRLDRDAQPDTSWAPGTLGTAGSEHCMAVNVHRLADGETTVVGDSTLVLASDDTWRCLHQPASIPAPSPGRVIRQLVTEAKARGAVPSAVSLGFTDLADSAASLWGATPEMTARTDDGLLDAISLWPGIETQMGDALTFRAWKGPRGSTLAAPITGANALQRVDYAWDPPQPNTLLVTWAGGQFTADDPTRVSVDGVIEGDLALADVTERNAAEWLADRELERLARTDHLQARIAVTSLAAGVEPVKDWWLGDTVTISGHTGRVAGVRVREVDEMGRTEVFPELMSRTQFDAERAGVAIARGVPGTLSGGSRVATPTRWLEPAVTAGGLVRYPIQSFAQGALVDINDDPSGERSRSTPEVFDRWVRLTWIKVTCVGVLTSPLTIWVLKNGSKVGDTIVLGPGVHHSVWFTMGALWTFAPNESLAFELRDKGAGGGWLKVAVVAVEATASRVDRVGRLPWDA